MELIRECDRAINLHSVTPASALKEIKAIHDDYARLIKTLKSIQSGLRDLKFEPDTLDDDAREVGIVLPDSLHRRQLADFQGEIDLLNRHMRVFAELSSESVAGVKIRSIACGSLDVFLEASPATAVCIVVAIERIAALYKKILEIRKLRLEIERQELGDAAIWAADERELTITNDHLEHLADDIMSQSSIQDRGRENELRIGLGKALRYLADRIDKGVDFEVRFPLIDSDEDSDAATEEGSTTGSEPQDESTMPDRELQRRGSALSRLERSEQPILRLTGTLNP